jgi:hypothetical protein
MRENTVGHPPLRLFHLHATDMVTDEPRYADCDQDLKCVILESEKLDGLTCNGRGTGRVGLMTMAAWPSPHRATRHVESANIWNCRSGRSAG